MARPMGELVEMRPLRGVRLFGHDELVGDRLAVVFAEVHGRSERRAIVRNLVEIHDRDLGNAFLEHRDARVDDALAILRGLVFRVLAQVAELARALDFLRQLVVQFALELGDFVFEFLEDFRLHPKENPSTSVMLSR